MASVPATSVFDMLDTVSYSPAKTVVSENPPWGIGAESLPAARGPTQPAKRGTKTRSATKRRDSMAARPPLRTCRPCPRDLLYVGCEGLPEDHPGPVLRISSRSFVVVFQLRIVIDLYAGVAMILFRRLLVRSALRRCE